MLKPHIQTLTSSLTPWQVYQNLSASSPVSFFLDSPSYQPPDQRFSYLGAEPSLTLEMKHGRIRLAGEKQGNFPASCLLKLMRESLRLSSSPSARGPGFFFGGLVGYLGYEVSRLFDKIKFRKRSASDFAEAYFGLYREVIVFDHQKKKYSLVVNPRPKDKPADIDKRFKHLCSFFRPIDTSEANRPFLLKKFRPETSRREFESMVRKAKAYIRAGDIYQANLSQRFLFDYQGSPAAIYEKLRGINPSPFSSILKFGNAWVLSCSPERLIRKKGRGCETRPIAGTYPVQPGTRNVSHVRKGLLASPKERAEHIMLVDLERNDLGRVCDYRSVRVEEMMTMERYSHVAHLVSKVTGRLKPGQDGLDLIRAMFPGGTITGCPKIRCMEIIDELEKSGRGLYTGSLGYLDFRGDLDFNIMIRSSFLKKGRGILQTGAGIVYDSEPRREYEETLHKAEALAAALNQASDS